MSELKNVVITGGAGLLALNIAAYKKKDWKITLIVRNHDVFIEGVFTEKISLDNETDIFNCLSNLKPDLIIHAAGLTNIEYCEENHYETRLSNVIISKNIATVARKLNIKHVHISTDHFSRSDKQFSTEDEIELPINEYAHSKLEAEINVIKSNDKSLILRTNFFAWGSSRKESISDFIINKLRNNCEVSLFDDIFFTPILSDTLVDKMESLISINTSGIYNLVGKERVSKYEFGLLIADIFGLDRTLIKKSSIKDARLKVKRPLDMSLSSTKIEKNIGLGETTLMSDLENLKLIEENGRSEIVINSVKNDDIENIYYGSQNIDDQDVDSVVSTVCSNSLTQGPKIAEFENSISSYTGAKYSLAICNLTSGLHIACLALGLKPGDYIITSPISFVASSNAAIYCGATPLFADIEKKSVNIDPGKVEELCIKYKEKIKILIVVHFSGHPCDMVTLKKLSKKYNFKIIEDAAHALGGEYHSGGKIGNCGYSEITGFSFHPVKSITTGEGGVLTTNNQEVYEQLCRLRSHGITKGSETFKNPEEAYEKNNPNSWYYEMQELGFNYRITDIQCALGISQLSKLDSFMKLRREIAHIYDSNFSTFQNLEVIQRDTRNISGNHLYVVSVNFKKIGMCRNELYSKLEEYGIKAHVHYIPIPLQPYYQVNYNENIQNYPNAYEYYKTAVTLPFHTLLNEEKIMHIINILKKIVG